MEQSNLNLFFYFAASNKKSKLSTVRIEIPLSSPLRVYFFPLSVPPIIRKVELTPLSESLIFELQTKS